MRGFFWKLVVVLLLCLSPLSSVAAQDNLSSQYFPETGFAVSDDGSALFLTEFRRLGGLEVLGYPASKPYDAGGFRYQVFQRAILQWRPELGRALLANTFDWLTDQGKDDWLYSLGIPRPVSDSGGSWDQVVAEREGWLIEPSIAQAYRSRGGLERFGLPQSRPERRGPFIVQRFQRGALQLWVDQVAGMLTPGTVVGILTGDLAKQAGLVPPQAVIPSAAVAAPPSVPGAGLNNGVAVNADAEQAALSMINQARRANGLPPVVMDNTLQQVARAYAMDMATRNFFDHTDPDGRTLADRIKASGAQNWASAVENLGYGLGFGSVADAVRVNHDAMMAETPPNDGHRRNILNGKVRRVGIGVVQRLPENEVYYVADFTY